MSNPSGPENLQFNMDLDPYLKVRVYLLTPNNFIMGSVL